MATKFDDNQKAPRDAPKPGSTTSASTMIHRVSPQDDGLSSSNIPADAGSMRGILSKCTMSPHESENPRGISLDNLIKNLLRSGKLEMDHYKLGHITLYTLVARKSAFILSSHSAESLYEDPRFMHLSTDLKNRSVLYTQKGTRLYLYPLGSDKRLGSEELRKLEGLAKRQNGRPSLPPPAPEAKITDSLQLDPEKGVGVTTDSFKKRFARCEVLEPDAKGFDPKAFAESIHVVSAFTDLNGSAHYVIIAGKEEDCYTLYVNADSTAVPGKGIALGYGQDFCLLYRDA